MSKNVAFIYTGISGLFCQCGNAEVITNANPRYQRFGSWWETSGARGQSKVTCRKCNSDTHTPEVRPQPADVRDRLQAAYPDANVDELMTQCATGQ
ncbi:hypothetical protein [Pseudoduganella sp. GCM10020061]|uniref:hypothetical protein n=1 Tax=Pseudoduganella sp. GCM10020061 TaxID=3317345 RepID=UPI00362C0730